MAHADEISAAPAVARRYLAAKPMRAGVLQFSRGCFVAIWNLATHGTRDVAPQEALEQLAILRALARWIDGCELVEAETP